MRIRMQINKRDFVERVCVREWEKRGWEKRERRESERVTPIWRRSISNIHWTITSLKTSISKQHDRGLTTHTWCRIRRENWGWIFGGGRFLCVRWDAPPWWEAERRSGERMYGLEGQSLERRNEVAILQMAKRYWRWRKTREKASRVRRKGKSREGKRKGKAGRENDISHRHHRESEWVDFSIFIEIV